MGAMIISQLIIILLISYIIVVLIRRLPTLIAVVVVSIITYSLYGLLQRHGVRLSMILNTIIVNTQELIEKLMEIMKTIIQQILT